MPTSLTEDEKKELDDIPQGEAIDPEELYVNVPPVRTKNHADDVVECRHFYKAQNASSAIGPNGFKRSNFSAGMIRWL